MAIGKLIVIEGSDGSGKETQSKKLYSRLLSEGKNVKLITFPNYKSRSSSLVKMYLEGEFGDDLDRLNTKAVSTFFAVDRFASYKKDWEEFYLGGGIVIADRYTTSNMVHQAAKMDCDKDKEEYLDWLWDLEFNLYGLPIPDKVIFLDVKPEISRKLMEGRNNKISNENQKDIHERNSEFLKSSYKNSLFVSERYNWSKISCVHKDEILSVDFIHELIYEEVKTLFKNKKLES